MKVRFRLRRRDLLLDEEEFYPSLEGELVDGALSYTLEDGASMIRMEDDRIVLEHKGETHSIVHLYRGKEGGAVLHSAYGVMGLKTRLLERKVSDCIWGFSYAMMQDEGNVSLLQFEIEFLCKGENM